MRPRPRAAFLQGRLGPAGTVRGARASRTPLSHLPSATHVSEARSSGSTQLSNRRVPQKKQSEPALQQLQAPKLRGADAECGQEGARKAFRKCTQQVAPRVLGAGGRAHAPRSGAPGASWRPESRGGTLCGAGLSGHPPSRSPLREPGSPRRTQLRPRHSPPSPPASESPRAVGRCPGPRPTIPVNATPSSPARGCRNQCQSCELFKIGTQSGFKVPSDS